MSSFNKVSLFGNVGKDAEVKHFDGGKVNAKFSLATSESWGKGDDRKTETQWHNIVCWGPLAELCEKYVKKGMSVIIDGKITYRSYENKDNQTVHITEIIGDQLYFTGKKEAIPEQKLDNNEGQFVKEQGSATKEAIVNSSKENANNNEDDLPF